MLTRQTEQREQQLFDEGIIAQRRLQEARAAAREADANLAQARSALRLAGMSPAAIEQVAKSGVAQDTVALHATDLGIVTEMDIKPGQRVEAATPLVQIRRTAKLDIEIQLPLSQVAGWAVGASVEVVDHGVSGRVVGICPAVQASSQTSVVRAAINGKPGNLRPGELIMVNLGAVGSSPMWELPQASVVHNGQQAYVFVRTADGFEAHPVTAGNDLGGTVRVTGQFKAGDQLASGGTAALKAAWLAARGSK